MSKSAFEIVHDDRHLLIVVKPAGIATTAPGGKDSLTQRLEREHGALHPTSRLDAEVTGLVTFAKTREARERLLVARAEGRYHRGYLAIASREPPEREGTWDAPIAIDPRDRTLRIAGRGERTQEARTTFLVREIARGRAALWLTPHTGRTHQLRVHAAHAGLPLVGDVRYGGEKRIALDDGSIVTARRTMLHCAWLHLPDLELCARAPDDMRTIWTRLGGTEAALAQLPAES